jgi:ADP-ribosylglycohydrolase
MGGDVDSLAAVCTGIASGTYGTDSLPQFLFEQTEGLDRMQKLGEKLYEKFFFS